MDQIAARTEAERSPPTRLREFGEVSPDPAVVDPAEHSIMFASLVIGDADIVGLVAYSIYKQNKYDWLHAYGRLEGRMPEPAEVQSYLLGESTPRRLATYRHLAQAVLDGRGPDVPGAPAAAAPPPTASGRRLGTAARPRPVGLAPGQRSGVQFSARAIVGLFIALVVSLVLLWLMHSGAPLPPPTPGK